MPPLIDSSRIDPSDPMALAQALIRCASVTPKDEGAIGVVEAALAELGFACRRLRFGEIENLYARLGEARPVFCFAGHTDVVPVGDRAGWTHDPFAGEVNDGMLYGRGAADMKGGIAAFVAAVAQKLRGGWKPAGSISLVITGDEEGVSIDGTAKVLEWMAANGEVPDHCLVGEPTSAARTGDMIKIGRRGSVTAFVRVIGVQGHVGYPQRALNPIPILAEFIRQCPAALDKGTEHFEPSTLSFTTVDVGNPAANVIPAEARATLNVRFNDTHSADSIKEILETTATSVTAGMGGTIAFEWLVGGNVFFTRPGAFTELVSAAAETVTGITPELSTTGGTSDARFIRAYCPVAERGLVGTTMHKVNECVPLADLETMVRVYGAVLTRYFERPPS
jgi:succinyl-diaminopimelate desuccinylase